MCSQSGELASSLLVKDWTFQGCSFHIQSWCSHLQWTCLPVERSKQVFLEHLTTFPVFCCSCFSLFETCRWLQNQPKLIFVRVRWSQILKLGFTNSGDQASCSMRLLRKQLCCSLPSLFLLELAFYFVSCRSLFSGQFAPKINYQTKRSQGKLQRCKLVRLSLTTCSNLYSAIIPYTPCNLSEKE